MWLCVGISRDLKGFATTKVQTAGTDCWAGPRVSLAATRGPCVQRTARNRSSPHGSARRPSARATQVAIAVSAPLHYPRRKARLPLEARRGKVAHPHPRPHPRRHQSSPFSQRRRRHQSSRPRLQRHQSSSVDGYSVGERCQHLSVASLGLRLRVREPLSHQGGAARRGWSGKDGGEVRQQASQNPHFSAAPWAPRPRASPAAAKHPAR